MSMIGHCYYSSDNKHKRPLTYSMKGLLYQLKGHPMLYDVSYKTSMLAHSIWHWFKCINWLNLLINSVSFIFFFSLMNCSRFLACDDFLFSSEYTVSKSKKRGKSLAFWLSWSKRLHGFQLNQKDACKLSLIIWTLQRLIAVNNSVRSDSSSSREKKNV